MYQKILVGIDNILNLFANNRGRKTSLLLLLDFELFRNIFDLYT